MPQEPDDLDEFEEEFDDEASVSAESEEDEVEAAAEVLENDIASMAAQRDEYLALAQRLQAEFENYKKQTTKRNTEVVEPEQCHRAQHAPLVGDARRQHPVEGADPIGRHNDQAIAEVVHIAYLALAARPAPNLACQQRFAHDSSLWLIRGHCIG